MREREKKMIFSHLMNKDVWAEMEEWYVPPKWIKKTDLILDVGARDGDSALFFITHGFTNLRLIEPQPDYFRNLSDNIDEFRAWGITIDWKYRAFRIEDLSGAAFAKFDCEGCETEIDLDKIGIPYIAELHVKNEPGELGIYQYAREVGYKSNYRSGVRL